jgi:hypothetical protein
MSVTNCFGRELIIGGPGADVPRHFLDERRDKSLVTNRHLRGSHRWCRDGSRHRREVEPLGPVALSGSVGLRARSPPPNTAGLQSHCQKALDSLACTTGAATAAYDPPSTTNTFPGTPNPTNSAPQLTAFGR